MGLTVCEPWPRTGVTLSQCSAKHWKHVISSNIWKDARAEVQSSVWGHLRLAPSQLSIFSRLLDQQSKMSKSEPIFSSFFHPLGRNDLAWDLNEALDKYRPPFVMMSTWRRTSRRMQRRQSLGWGATLRSQKTFPYEIQLLQETGEMWSTLLICFSSRLQKDISFMKFGQRTVKRNTTG